MIKQKKIVCLILFLFVVIQHQVQAKDQRHFKLKDFEGSWAFMGGSKGDVNPSLVVSQIGHLTIKRNGKGTLNSFERAAWTGPVGTPIAVTEVPFPLVDTELSPWCKKMDLFS